MTPRDRVFRTLEFAQPDQAPRQLWALPWVGMYARDEMAAFHQDFPSEFTGPGAVLGSSGRRQGVESRKGTYVDDWSCVWECAEDGVVGEVKSPPLADWDALRHFQPPWQMLERANWDEVNRAQERNLAGEQKFMLCGTTVRPFERMQFLRGSEALLMDLGWQPPELFSLRSMVHDFFLTELEGWAGTDCDAISFMDDWGAQNSLLISPAQWREVFKPLYRDYCDIIHAAGKKVFFHSDGHIFDIYEDLIEIGVDAVNSQLFCMDIEEIGRRFKGRITFWGEICRQKILPFGTVADVRAAVARVRRALDDGSGGLIAECEWGVRTPAENVHAVYESWLVPLNELETLERPCDG